MRNRRSIVRSISCHVRRMVDTRLCECLADIGSRFARSETALTASMFARTRITHADRVAKYLRFQSTRSRRDHHRSLQAPEVPAPGWRESDSLLRLSHPLISVLRCSRGESMESPKLVLLVRLGIERLVFHCYNLSSFDLFKHRRVLGPRPENLRSVPWRGSTGSALQSEFSRAVLPEQAPLADVPPYHLNGLVPGLIHDGPLRCAPNGRRGGVPGP